MEQKLAGRFRAEEIVAVIYQRYYNGSRRQGSRDPEFLDRINGVFICFVATAIRHCLKAWRTGELAESGPDFKYETNWGKLLPDPLSRKILTKQDSYTRLRNTWCDFKLAVQELIVNNIKADLVRRIAVHVKVVDSEPTEAPEREDKVRYEEELRKELDYLYDRLKVHVSKRRRENGELRDPSVELEIPLDPEIRDDMVPEEEFLGEE